MKAKIGLTVCAVFVLGLVLSASAQMRAGSPEDRAFTAIENEKDTDAQIKLLLDFEKNFGADPANSKVMPLVWSMLMNDYAIKKDVPHVNEFGEKVIKAEPENYDALMAVSRSYSMGKSNPDKAVSYAERAIAAIAKQKTSPPPANFTGAQWQEFLTTRKNSAKSILIYAKSVKGP